MAEQAESRRSSSGSSRPAFTEASKPQIRIRFIRSSLGKRLSRLSPATLLMLAIPAILLTARLWGRETIPGIITYLGWPILAVALFGIYWARLERRRHAAIQHGEGERRRRIVTSGPYVLLRHPEYLGYVALLLGVALLGGSGFGFLWLGLYWAWMIGLRIPTEEVRLVKRYGRHYKNYRRQVRTWI